MSNVIPGKTMEILPSTVKNQLAKMSEEQQNEFVEEFNRKFKPKSAVAASFITFLGFHYLYYNKIMMFIIFVCTFGGCGFWWLMDWRRSGKIVKEYNQEKAKDVSMEVLKEIKILNA